MSRPISIAIACSIVIHLALFLIADSLLRARAQPAIISTPLVVNIESRQTTGDVVDDRRAVPAVDTEAAKPAETSRASRPADGQPRIAEAAEMVVAAEITSTALDPAPEATGADTPAEGEKVAAANVVATDSTAKHTAVVRPPQAAPPELTQATFSSSQEKMLNRKVREWTEKLHRMPEVASGLTWNHKGQEYVARFTKWPAGDEMGIERVVIEISTKQDGQRLFSVVHLKRLAFSNYAQFVNRWDPYVEIYNDALDGRFHSNTEINVAYDRKVRPVFEGKVTTSSRQIKFTRRLGSMKRDQIFSGGLQTGVRRIGLPRRFLPFPDEDDVSDGQVHRFADDTRITFHADGAFAWQTIGAASPVLAGKLSDGTTYFIADKKAELHVKGTVNGKVLVYSPERIVIEDDLVYAQSPEESSDADDYVGLVSDKYVDVASPEITGPGDLLINAAIYAKRRFAVRRFRARGQALLYLYGSLTAGSVSATEPRYYTRIQFDQRLENLRPPAFPMTDRYEIESWDATWNVEPIE